MVRISLFALPVAALLVACSDPEKTERYLIDTPEVVEQVPNRLGRVEIRDVSLPDYASGDEIAYQTEDGAVRASPDTIWADDPVRAVTHYLATQIALQSGAQAVAEPWPFFDRPDRRVEVRIDRMLARADGNFVLSGNYFVAPQAGGGLSRRFAISVPITAEGPAAIAAAQSEALRQLARAIATLS